MHVGIGRVLRSRNYGMWWIACGSGQPRWLPFTMDILGRMWIGLPNGAGDGNGGPHHMGSLIEEWANEGRAMKTIVERSLWEQELSSVHQGALV